MADPHGPLTTHDSDPLGQWVDPRTGELLDHDAGGTALPLAMAHRLARESSGGSRLPDGVGLSLDPATLTVEPPKPSYFRSSWVANVYETCGEATVYWRPPSPCSPTGVRGEGSQRATVEGNRRARRRMRRFCVHNKLNVLWTLTFDDEHLPDDWDGVWVEIERFRRWLYKHLGKKVPAVFVIERGEDEDGTKRLHVHMALGLSVDKRALEAGWGCGWVKYSKRVAQGGTKRVRGRREQARTVAAYLSAYLTKQDSTAAGREFDGKRYSVTKGFAARARSFVVPSPSAGFNVARSLCGGVVDWEFHSDDDPEWLGVPVHCYRFGDP